MWHAEWLQLDERTALQAEVDANRDYRLALWRDGERVVEFQCENGRHRGRQGAPYAFRSIEQLRYDFEREIEGLVGWR